VVGEGARSLRCVTYSEGLSSVDCSTVHNSSSRCCHSEASQHVIEASQIVMLHEYSFLKISGCRRVGL
jgi:hypothetical protein